MREIKVTKTQEKIASCNGCSARNYDSCLNVPGEKVYLLFDVQIGNSVSCLCKNCLNRLIGAAVTTNAAFE